MIGELVLLGNMSQLRCLFNLSSSFSSNDSCEQTGKKETTNKIKLKCVPRINKWPARLSGVKCCCLSVQGTQSGY